MKKAIISSTPIPATAGKNNNTEGESVGERYGRYSQEVTAPARHEATPHRQ